MAYSWGHDSLTGQADDVPELRMGDRSYEEHGGGQPGGSGLSRLCQQESLRRLTDPKWVPADWVKDRATSRHPLRDGFAPKGSDLRDFSIVRGRGRYHAFYIDKMHGKSGRHADNLLFIGHSSTADFQSWQVHTPALVVAPGTWEGGHVAAPHVFSVPNRPRLSRLAGIRVRFVMMYTGISANFAQSLGMAFSADLHHWVRYDGNPLLQPAHFEWACWRRNRLANCRDAHVLPRRGRYLLYYTALRTDGDCCIAAAASADLENWRDCGPVFTLPFVEASPAMIESSCVHPAARRFALFYTRAGGTWVTLSNDPLRFDARAEQTLLIENYWGLEVVRRRANRWLVALFRAQTAERGGALFLGVLTWTATRPRLKLARRPGDIAEFL